ncbi:MAG TPA: DUF2804 domain-containing protein [Termitinemataceae bacterium]|nr:DUF2804 domain-containing protein [Termitinemataceae bacterium]HOM23271.1 DUF2804 domain-containing protein [Termitinemataceae bacterium]HPQ00182.1 DUF2804 domain-containing protein [Termitinemataceae bacterium]
MQREITEPLRLLTPEGHLTSEGWARFPYWEYRRDDIKASPLRIKEWDYYMVFSHHGQWGISFTLSDLGYLGLAALCFLDFKQGYYHQVENLSILPLGRLGLPESSTHEGEINVSSRKLSLTYTYQRGKRTIAFASPLVQDSQGNRGIEGTIELEQPENLESTVIAISWQENRRAFYYNQKVNCMPARGNLRIGNHTYPLNPETDRGSLDWGRGVWTYKNTWYWASLSTVYKGTSLGINLGYGFSDRSPASENTILYDGRIHKLEEVTFHFNPENHMEDWHFSSSDGRVELTLHPRIDRQSNFNFGVLQSRQHQVFGEFSGSLILDSGERLDLPPTLGMTEHVYNRW